MPTLTEAVRLASCSSRRQTGKQNKTKSQLRVCPVQHWLGQGCGMLQRQLNTLHPPLGPFTHSFFPQFFECWSKRVDHVQNLAQKQNVWWSCSSSPHTYPVMFKLVTPINDQNKLFYCNVLTHETSQYWPSADTKCHLDQ